MRTAPAPASVLDDDLGFTLGVVFRAYVRMANTVMADLPGGPRGFQVLSAAANDPACRQGVLAGRLGIDKTVMTYLVDDLERAALVERSADPDDRRNKRLAATPAGRSALERIELHLRQAELRMLTPLEPADREIFRDLLQRLAARAQHLDPVEDTCQVVTDIAPEDHIPKDRATPTDSVRSA